LSQFKTKKEKYDAMKSAYWLDENLRYHEPKALRRASTTLLKVLYNSSELKRKTTQKHLAQLDIILLGLLKASLSPYQCLVIPFNANEFSSMEKLSYRITVKFIVKGLLKLGYLTLHKGYYEQFVGVVSRLQLMESILQFLRDSELDPNLIVLTRPLRTLVTIKPPKATNPTKPILNDVQEAEIQRIENDLNLYNSKLSNTFLDLCVSEEEESQINERMARKVRDTGKDSPSRLWLEKKFIHRVFNNNSIELGGRHYGGWWQTVPSEWRQRIVIDGEKTIEIDYGQQHFRMLYQFEGSPKATTSSDLYHIDGIDPKHRDDNKSVYTALLNASSRNQVVRLIGEKRRKGIWYVDGLPDGIKNATDLLKVLESQHPEIESYFYSGVGLSLQNTDSKIMHKVIMRLLVEYNVVALPIHDSAVVKSKYKNILKNMMEEVYRDVMGVNPKLKVNDLMENKYLSLMDSNKGLQTRYRVFTEGFIGY
jgi:hypothetical protein